MIIQFHRGFVPWLNKIPHLHHQTFPKSPPFQRWISAPATGPVSQGVCQVCGEIREFKNYVEAATWGDSRLSKRANTEESKGTVKPVPTPAKRDEDEEEEDQE